MSQATAPIETLAVEQLDRCPACSSQDLRFWCKGFDRFHRVSLQEFKYSECKNCRLIFLSDRPHEPDIIKFYPSDYGPHQGGKQPEGPAPAAPAQPQKVEVKSRTYLQRLFYRSGNEDALERYRTLWQQEGKRTLLDFGCGSERFLNKARAAGWETTGIDFSPAVVERVRANGHRAYLVSPQVWEEIEDGSLSVVRMHHVLEHLYHHQEVLAAIHAKLRPGGVLHIGVPNPRGISAWLFRSRWFGLDFPRHLLLFGPRGLKQELQRLGFQDIQIDHEIVTKDLARSFGYLLADLKVIPDEDVRLLEYWRGLNAMLYPLARLATLVRWADRINVYARKPLTAAIGGQQ